MDTINNDLTNLLQQMGVHKESLGITQRIVIIAGILIIAFVADYFCRKIVVPTIKKLTARTQATWDDYLFNDAVLDNMCHLIPPIILYVLLPFADISFIPLIDVICCGNVCNVVFPIPNCPLTLYPVPHTFPSASNIAIWLSPADICIMFDTFCIFCGVIFGLF